VYPDLNKIEQRVLSDSADGDQRAYSNLPSTMSAR
jgi:hypothetical protein